MEIERKFLVKDKPSLCDLEFKELEQYYISFSPEVRVRKSNDDYYLTIKSTGGLIREEVETPIDKSFFNEIKKICPSDFIEKTRYYIPHGGYVCELDIYHNIEGLITVEVEFENENDAYNFIVPDWFGDEVTSIQEFKNANLAKFGFPNLQTLKIK